MANRDILATATPKVAMVDIGEGKQARIRALSGAGRVAYLKLFEATKESGGVRPAQIAALALCEEDGRPSFDATSETDLAFLDALAGDVLERIAVDFYKLSGLTAQAVDEAAKN